MEQPRGGRKPGKCIPLLGRHRETPTLTARSRQLISKVEAMLVCWGKTTPLSMDFYCDFIPLFTGNYGEFTFE